MPVTVELDKKGHPVAVVANAFFYDEQPRASKAKSNAEPVGDDELEDE